MNMDYLLALGGGILIGLAVTLMLLLNGRITGISGILYGLVSSHAGDRLWRAAFVGGLFFGGLLLRAVYPIAFPDWKIEGLGLVVVAGLLVGFGTVLGSGCTSGHGVCGISRMSLRSIVSTFIFMGAGILTVYIVRTMGVL